MGKLLKWEVVLIIFLCLPADKKKNLSFIYLFLGIFCVAVLSKTMLYVLPFQLTHSRVLGSYTHLQVVSLKEVHLIGSCMHRMHI